MRDYKIGRLKGRFVVTWDEGGKRRRYRLAASTAREADAEARDLIRMVTVGERAMTVADVWAAYRAEKDGRRIAHNMQWSGLPILAYFGHLRPEQITSQDCRDYAAARADEGRAAGTIWTELGHLRTSLKWAAEKARIIKYAPHIERPEKPAPRDRYLSRPEVNKLLAAECEPHIRLAILLMLTTAGRVAAILDLTWSRVDLERGTINLRLDAIGPRKGRAVVPINETLRPALINAREAALSEFVVEWAGGRVKSIKRGFARAVERAGIEHCSPHDLRRTAARFMVEDGVPIDEVAQYLGHSDPAITYSVYGRFSPGHLRRAADALNFGGPRLVQRTSGNSADQC